MTQSLYIQPTIPSVNTLRRPAHEVLAALQAQDGPLRKAWGDRLAPAPTDADGQQAAREPASAAAAKEEKPGPPVPYLHPTPPLSKDTILVPSIPAARRRRPEGQGAQVEEEEAAGAIGKHCLEPGTHVVVVDRCVDFSYGGFYTIHNHLYIYMH